MKTKSEISAYIFHSIAAAVLVISAQISLAGSATWLLSPQDSAWETANNWTPGGPPNGPLDIATFGQSAQTGVNISTSVEVNSIVFSSDAASFHLRIPQWYCGCAGELIMSSTGVINNSSVLQTFEVGSGLQGGVGQLIFNNTSTAASAQMRIFNNGASFPSNSRGETIFNDRSSAGGASIANGGTTYGAPSGQTIFNDTSTADHASITNYGADASNNPGNPGQTTFNGTSTAANASIDNIASLGTGNGGQTVFKDTSTAGHATITNEGGITPGHPRGGRTVFTDSSTADSAILVAIWGVNGSGGGGIFFSGASTGGTARVEVFNYGYLDISGHQSGVTIGSIEGSGNVSLGANNLTVGTNDIDTSFSGRISGSGSLAKVGSMVLTLQTNDCIADTVGLILVSGSIINLNYTGAPDVIASLVVDGVPQPPGVYGSAMSGAPHPLPQFQGLGTVQVVPVPQHPPFFAGEAWIGNGGVYYLQLPNGNVFGYYAYLTDIRWIYHFDMGYEYWFDANNADHGIFFYDFASTHFFYTSPSTFPYLYDFSLNAWLYYLPDANNPGRYTNNPRWFFNFATGQWITL